MRIEINVFVTAEFLGLQSSAILIFNFSIHRHLKLSAFTMKFNLKLKVSLLSLHNENG